MKLLIEWSSITTGVCEKECLEVRVFSTLAFDPQQKSVIVLNGAEIELFGPIVRIVYGGKELPLTVGWQLTAT